MKNSYVIVKSLLRTEKSTNLSAYNKYVFWVDMKSNKVDIRKAVEDIYDVKVAEVNTSVVKGKPKRVRMEQGLTSKWKRAIVTLKEGSKIDITS